MQDCWLPRLYVIGQMLIVGVCGALLALGRDSLITDLFLAASGSILGTQGYQIVTKKLQRSEQTGSSR